MNKRFTVLLYLAVLCLAISCAKEESKSAGCQECTLLPEVGPCNAAFPRYYFDQDSLVCKEFVWGGCSGVVPFETLEACIACECNE